MCVGGQVDKVRWRCLFSFVRFPTWKHNPFDDCTFEHHCKLFTGCSCVSASVEGVSVEFWQPLPTTCAVRNMHLHWVFASAI